MSGVQNPLCAAMEKFEYSLLKSLAASEYQLGARLNTRGRPTSEKLGAVNVHSKLHHPGKERFLKRKFLLAVVDDCYRRSCIQKLVNYEQPDISRALQPF